MGPGETAEGQVEVLNELDKAIVVSAWAKDWFILPENKGLTVDKWFTLKKSEFALEPGQKEVVPFSVTVPAPSNGAPQGMLMAMMSFMPKMKQGDGPVSMVMSVPVYVFIRGTENHEAVLKKFDMRRDGANLRCMVLAENKGNAPLRPKGRVEIFDRKIRMVDQIPFREGMPVFPGRVEPAAADIPWPAWKDGPYRARARLWLWDQEVNADFFFVFKRKKRTITLLPEKKARKLFKTFFSTVAKTGG